MDNKEHNSRILLVEDEKGIAVVVCDLLRGEGYDVEAVFEGNAGLKRALEGTFHLLILDVMLPGLNGYEICKSVRERGFEGAILMLTARGQVRDRVEGLQKGADDYLVKPFAFPELLARVRALLRRGRAEQAPLLKLADLEMDVMGRKARRGGHSLELTAREFELLEYLLRHKEQIVSREMLARGVWKETARATPLDNVMDVHINRLRRKVDEPFDRKLIHTVRGVGFVLREEE